MIQNAKSTLKEASVQRHSSIENKLLQISKIHKKCQRLGKKYWRDALKENNTDIYERYHFKSALYRNFEKRCIDLAWCLKHNKKFGEVPSWFYLEYDSYNRLLASRKAERKANFENTHRIRVWFLQTSLSADYGSFVCNKCGSTFYHSPTEVKLGKSVKYTCICGDCVNSIVTRDGGKMVFH